MSTKTSTSFIKLFVFLYITAGTLTGCFTASPIPTRAAQIIEEGVFIITKKGEQIDGAKIKVNAFVKNNGDLTLDGKVYRIEDLANYQYKGVFFSNFDNVWYQRMQKGTVEAYSRKTNEYRGTSSHTVTRAYISKNSGELKNYTTENLYDLIKDSKSAVEVFNAKYNKINDKTPWDLNYNKLVSVVAAYK